MNLPSYDEFREKFLEKHTTPTRTALTSQQVADVFDEFATRTWTEETSKLVLRAGIRRDGRTMGFLVRAALDGGYASALKEHEGAPAPTEQVTDAFDQALAQFLESPQSIDLVHEHKATEAALLAGIRTAIAATTNPTEILTLVDAYYKIPPNDYVDDYDSPDND